MNVNTKGHKEKTTCTGQLSDPTVNYQYVKYDRFALFTAAKVHKVRCIKQNQERTLQNSIKIGEIPLGTRNTHAAKYFQ